MRIITIEIPLANWNCPMLSVPSCDENPGSVSTGADLRSPSAATPAVSEFDSARLLRGRREILIRHGGECYRLRHTRNDKLILTK